MAIVLSLRLDRQSRTALVGLQQAHLYILVQDSQDACLSHPPPSPMSHLHHPYLTHPLPMRAESVCRLHHCTHNARLLLHCNCAILRSHPSSHATLASLRLSNHLHYLEALSTLPVIHLPLRRLPQTSFHSPMVNFCRSSIGPRRFRTLSPRLLRID